MIIQAVIGKVKKYMKRKYKNGKLYVWHQYSIHIPSHTINQEKAVVLSIDEFIKIAEELRKNDLLGEITILLPSGRKKVEELNIDEFKEKYGGKNEGENN